MGAFGSQNIWLTLVDMFDVGPFRENTRGECETFTIVKSILVIFNTFSIIAFYLSYDFISRMINVQISYVSIILLMSSNNINITAIFQFAKP